MRFWQAVATATLTADFVRTNTHDWPWWIHCLANATDMLIVAAMWAAFKWLFSEESPANASINGDSPSAQAGVSKGEGSKP